MGNTISVSDKVNNNWDQLECSYLGGPLQSMGLAPGDPKKTAEKCQQKNFDSMFQKNMGGTVKSMNVMNSTIGMLKKDLGRFKDVVNAIKAQVGKDVAVVVSKFFELYKKIANIVFVFIKHLNNIMRIFRDSFNILFGFYWLFASLLNLLATPVNAMGSLIQLFNRKPSPFQQTATGLGSILGSGISKLPGQIGKIIKKESIDPIAKPFKSMRKKLRKIGIKV